MGLKQDLVDAVDDGRGEVVRVLAEHQVLPVVVERESSNLLGGSQTADFAFEKATDDGTDPLSDRQTRTMIIDTLGLTAEDECEDVREEIQNHPNWGG